MALLSPPGKVEIRAKNRGIRGKSREIAAFDAATRGSEKRKDGAFIGSPMAAKNFIHTREGSRGGRTMAVLPSKKIDNFFSGFWGFVGDYWGLWAPKGVLPSGRTPFSVDAWRRMICFWRRQRVPPRALCPESVRTLRWLRGCVRAISTNT